MYLYFTTNHHIQVVETTNLPGVQISIWEYKKHREQGNKTPLKEYNSFLATDSKEKDSGICLVKNSKELL
jgi:hypothetical protein